MIVIGDKFGRWAVVSFLGRDKRRADLWRCECMCGTTKTVRGSRLRNGNSRSCGCLRSQLASRLTYRHGYASRKTGRVRPEYYAYQKAKGRCTNPKDKNYPDYGGRGIEFRFSTFEQWLEELGEKPSPDLTVERINNDGHYEEGNLRWATRKQQANNRRMRK